MTSKNRRSRRAGIGVLGGRFVQLYEALQTHRCTLCERQIQPGEFFTRGGVHGMPSTIPICRECHPAVPHARAMHH